jgi:ABC-type uncharacterized transport system substrate-binding protein
LSLPSDPFTLQRGGLITSLCTSNRVPGIYAFRGFAHQGGLVAYGIDLDEQLRQAAGYVDRILKGERPANLPVQAPTKYQLVINLKTAKILGLNIPQVVARDRRRGDRIEMLFAAVHESVCGGYCCKSRRSNISENLAKAEV